MSKKKEIIQLMQSMIGRYSYYEVYNDWVKLCALTIQNNITYRHDSVWRLRENQYIDTIKKYSVDEQKKLMQMFYMLWDAFEENMSDVLGEIYMESGCSNKNTGQFFTPFHLSYLTAQIGIPIDISEENKLMMNEPSTGGGGMIIAAAKVLKERGLNYQTCMRVTAQDLDWHGVYMTYVQMSVLGIKGIVLQGSSISQEQIADYPPERIFDKNKSKSKILYKNNNGDKKMNQLEYYLFGIMSFVFACWIFLLGILLEEKIMKKLTGKGIIESLKDIIKYK